MPWFRIDDGLPEHPKSIALWKACGKQWDIHAVAGLLWRDMGCDCSRRKSEGKFERERAYRVVRAPEEIIDKALAALVEVGFMSCHGDDFAYHDWTQYNPTREEIDAKRAEISAKRQAAGSKGGTTTKERREQRISTGAANEQQTSSKPPAKGEQGASNAAPPIPHSPFPNSPPPTPPVAGAATDPSDEPASDADDGPPADSEPDPVVVDPENQEPRNHLRLVVPSETRVVTRPPLDPNYDRDGIMLAMATAKGSTFDHTNYTPDTYLDFSRRLCQMKIDLPLAVEMGELTAYPAKIWPYAKDKLTTGVRIAWALGKAASDGSREGSNLSVWVSVARKSLARKAAEAAALDARRVAAESAAVQPARPLATPADAAAARPAFVRTAPAAPAATEVTHG